MWPPKIMLCSGNTQISSSKYSFTFTMRFAIDCSTMLELSEEFPIRIWSIHRYLRNCVHIHAIHCWIVVQWVTHPTNFKAMHLVLTWCLSQHCCLTCISICCLRFVTLFKLLSKITIHCSHNWICLHSKISWIKAFLHTSWGEMWQY